jgi:apolipoprotein N-acyltransferase
LAGLLLVACFAPVACPVCGWIALVPAWWVITRSERVRRNPMRYGYLTGLLFFGGVFWWIGNVTAIGTFFLVLYLALYPALWFLFVARLVARERSDVPLVVIWRALAAAALWVSLEWWRSWFLTGFNWNELGISQAPSLVFRQLAAFGGVHLISFVLVTVNILWAEGVLGIAKTLQEKRVVRVSVPFGAALVIVALCFAIGWHHLRRHVGEQPAHQVTYACIQPNIPQIPYDPNSKEDFETTEERALKKTEEMSLSTVATHPDLLIWPEAMISEGVFQDRPLNEAVHTICREYGGYFLLGSQDFDIGGGRKLYNVAYFFTPHGEEYDEYRKTHLVILGEFLPFANRFPILRKWAGVGMDFSPGPGPKRFEMTHPALTFSPLICFEDTLPEVADKAAKLNPDFFITITNDGWYSGWCARWGIFQHLNHSVFRCVEHDRPMIRCANTGISCEIDQNGTVTKWYADQAGKEIDVGGIFSGTLQPYPTHGTLYERWGDWIVLISALVSVMLGLRFFCRPIAR